MPDQAQRLRQLAKSGKNVNKDEPLLLLVAKAGWAKPI